MGIESNPEQPPLRVIDVAQGLTYDQLSPHTLVEGFEATTQLDRVIENIGWVLIGALSDKDDLLTPPKTFRYAKGVHHGIYTHPYNEQTLKGLFRNSTKPSARLQPKNLTAPLQHPRLLVLDPPASIEGVMTFSGKSTPQYSPDHALHCIAAADVVVTGKGPVGTSVGEFLMWTYLYPTIAKPTVSLRWVPGPSRNSYGVNAIGVAKHLLRATHKDRTAIHKLELEQLLRAKLDDLK